MGGKWPQNPGSGSGVPELDISARAAPPASGPRQARPNLQGNQTRDPQDLFGAGTFDADFFGAGAGGTSKLDLGDSPGAMGGGVGFGNELTLDPSAASNLELGEALSSAADPFANYGSGNLDFGDFDESLPPLQGGAQPLALLSPDVEPEADRSGEYPSRPSQSGVHGRPRQQSLTALPREYPRGDTPAPNELPIDRVDVEVAADFGEAPKGWVTAPVYAWRVFLRRRELKSKIRLAEHRLVSLEAQRDHALAEFADTLRGDIERDQSASRLLQPLHEVEQRAGERSDAFAAVEHDFQEKCGALDQQDVDLQVEQEGLRQQIGALDHEASQYREQYKRAEVAFKRLHIELRSANELVSMAAAGASTADPEAAAQRARELEQQIAAETPGVQQLRHELELRERPLREALHRMETLERERGQLSKERKQLSEALRKQTSLRTRGLNEVQAEVVQALTEVGRQVLRTPGNLAVDEAQLRPIREHSEKVYDAAVELELWARAMYAFDEIAYRRGGQLIFGSLGLLVVVCVIRVLI
ncbi:MAG: hypothetical protein AB7K71_25525 [Polyangiaceae bacterium]